VLTGSASVFQGEAFPSTHKDNTHSNWSPRRAIVRRCGNCHTPTGADSNALVLQQYSCTDKLVVFHREEW